MNGYSIGISLVVHVVDSSVDAMNIKIYLVLASTSSISREFYFRRIIQDMALSRCHDSLMS
jgi:hypothetical protein